MDRDMAPKGDIPIRQSALRAAAQRHAIFCSCRLSIVLIRKYSRDDSQESEMGTLIKKAPRIALIQFHVPTESTTLSQSKRAERFIRQAAVENADLANLPEMALGLYGLDSFLRYAEACAVELLNF